MRRKLYEFLNGEKAQVSIEFILLTGGVVAAAIIFWSVGGTIGNLGNTVETWVGLERNLTIARVTR